ncbi:hypothetical protein F5884DRAFT_885825 [Xylogone sp. PMI_703]|nr:hypothetical protein F5884DRAFT_885825 [Xylogone sp. PMI_703]
MIRLLSKLAAPASDSLSELGSLAGLSIGSIHEMREAYNNLAHSGHQNEQPQMEIAKRLIRMGSWKPEFNNTRLQADPFRRFDSSAARLDWRQPQYPDQTDSPDDLHEGIFHVLVTFSAFVTSEWELTRELCYLAISEPAKDLLFKKTHGLRRRSSRRFTCPQYEDVGNIRPEAIAEYTKRLLGATAQQTLAACLYCISLCPSVRRISEDDSDTASYRPSTLYEDAGLRYSLEPRPNRASRDTVWSLYRKHQIGRNEPEVAFLNVSKRLDELRISTSKTRGRSSPWSSYNIAPGELAVLASAPPIKGSLLANVAENCIFVIDRVKTTQLLPLLRAQGRRFNYRYLTARLSAKFPPEVSWNSTHSIRKRGSSEIGDDILAYVEQALAAKSALREKRARENAKDGLYQPDIDSSSNDSAYEDEESESEEDNSDHDEESESSSDNSQESYSEDEDDSYDSD